MPDDDAMTHPSNGPPPLHVDRALSPFEVVFWRLAQAGTLNVTTIAAVQGPLTEAILVVALQALQRRHPLLQVRIGDADRPPRFVTSGVPNIPLRIIDQSARDCHAVIEGEISRPIDTAPGPLARCTWIRHGDATHHLLLTFHHVIGDGMSGVLMIRDVMRSAAAQLAATDATPAMPPLVDSRPMDLRLPQAARGLRGAWKQVRFVAGMASSDLRLRPPMRPTADQPAALAERRTMVDCRTIDASLLTRLAQCARDHTTTVHGALSAAILLAMAKDNSATAAMSVKHRTPVNMRQLLEPQVGEDVGMFASMAFYRGRVRADADFWDLAREVRTSVKAQIDQGVPLVLVGMLPRLDRMIGGDRLAVDEFGARWQARTPSTSGLTNLGRVELGDDFGPLDVGSLQFAVSPGGLGDCACTATTYRGTLHWNFVYAAPVFAAERARGITNDAVDRLMRAIAD